MLAGLRGRLGPVGLIGGGAPGRGLTSHVPRLMAGTVGTFGTVGNDALDTRGRLGNFLDFGDRLLDTRDIRRRQRGKVCIYYQWVTDYHGVTSVSKHPGRENTGDNLQETHSQPPLSHWT